MYKMEVRFDLSTAGSEYELKSKRGAIGHKISDGTCDTFVQRMFAGQLQLRHPMNNNIRPKIRQQLQVLRDRGFLEFIGRGLYRKKKEGSPE